MKKRGISLIVLIITIIVVIILAAVVILTLSKNNPIESAKEARFKEDVRTFQDELALTVSKQYTSEGGHRDTKISTSDFDKIKEYIPSFSEKYRGKFIIQDDELVYTKDVIENERMYLESLNVKKQAATQAATYVTDGLIVHLDGINNTRTGHSDNTTIWEDISGNGNDFIKLPAASKAKWSENSYVGDGVNRTLVLSKAVLEGKTACTVEVCYDVSKLKSYIWIFQSRQENFSANGFEFWTNSGSRDITIFKNNSNYDYDSLSNFNKVTNTNKRTEALALDSNNIIFSDNSQTYTRSSNQNVINSIFPRNIYTIGSNYPWEGDNIRWNFEGNIYSIRIYNRKLSEDELRNNYEVDKARFGME